MSDPLGNVYPINAAGRDPVARRQAVNWARAGFDTLDKAERERDAAQRLVSSLARKYASANAEIDPADRDWLLPGIAVLIEHAQFELRMAEQGVEAARKLMTEIGLDRPTDTQQRGASLWP